MRKKEKQFALAKNLLDNKYQKTLVLFEMTILSIVSATIAFIIYFYQISQTQKLIDALGYGTVTALVFTIFFLGLLYDLEEKIIKL